MREKSIIIIRSVIELILIAIGIGLGITLLPDLWQVLNLDMVWLNWPIISGFIGALIFIPIIFLSRPFLTSLIRSSERMIRYVSFSQLVMSTIGLMIGLTVASLINRSLSNFPLPFVRDVLPFLTSILLGITGVLIAAIKGDDIRERMEELYKRYEQSKAEPSEEKEEKEEEPTLKTEDSLVPMSDEVVRTDEFQPYKLLDTNILIDGRIVEVMKTGFIEGTLVVPNFVLKELQYIADSSDNLRRVRGRRGLDVLNQLKSMEGVNIEFYTGDVEEEEDVDLKLLVLAQKLGGVVITNDFNLNKVSQFRQVQILNLNALASALKMVVVPGDSMTVQIVKPGTERQQGVGYLDDGTMIVVEEGKKHMDELVEVEVTSAIQTNAGKMIFGKIKEE